MRGDDVDFLTVTPKLRTSEGSCEAAWPWRIWVRTWSMFGSVFTSKLTYIFICPLFALSEYM